MLAPGGALPYPKPAMTIVSAFVVLMTSVSVVVPVTGPPGSKGEELPRAVEQNRVEKAV